MFKSARKQANKSIEGAAFDLHIGTRTLVNYENGHTLIPPDVVLKMSEVYEQPRLAARYCSERCPIGQRYAHKVKDKSLARSVLSIIKELNDVKAIRETLVAIAADGQIDANERAAWEMVIQELSELGQEIETLKWWARSQQRQKPAPAIVAEERVVYRTKKEAVSAAR